MGHGLYQNKQKLFSLKFCHGMFQYFFYVHLQNLLIPTIMCVLFHESFLSS